MSFCSGPPYRKFLWPVLMVLGTAALVAFLHFFSAELGDQKVPLRIVRADGSSVSFEVELALTSEQQTRGLMFRKELPEGTGMLFLFDPPREAAFWMKNTLIPLDMLFIAPDGRIARIVAKARPHDETPVSSDGPVRGVLEIGGGQAEALKIAVGDRLANFASAPR